MSGLNFLDTDFTKVLPGQIQPGAFLYGADINNNRLYSKMDSNLVISIIEGGAFNAPYQIAHDFIAGQILGGQRVVMLSGGKAVYFNPNNENNIGRVLGITKHAAILNASVNVIMDGIIINAGWGLTTDAIYYADNNGMITTAIPAPPFIFQRIGIAVNPNTLKLEFSEPISTN
jgi:hypothetical protein